MAEYYPKSQIKKDQYTEGSEYRIKATQVPYKGYYYCISNGNKYTGRFPGDGPNQVLEPTFNTDPANPTQASTQTPLQEILITDQEKYPYDFTDFDSGTYNRIKNVKPISRFIPSPNITFPTDKDMKKGSFVRYFCKKNNELIFFEIDKSTYNKLIEKKKDIVWELYTATKITWNLTSASRASLFIVNRNRVISKERELQWFGFSSWFNDKFVRYSRYSI
tara:strand:+ start:8697 stop:9356 length:660 start_codon:yes stop_codon:yes gene_type:complete